MRGIEWSPTVVVPAIFAQVSPLKRDVCVRLQARSRPFDLIKQPLHAACMSKHLKSPALRELTCL